MNKVKTNANEIYQMLTRQDIFSTLHGYITFNMGGIQAIIKKKDAVGSIIQEWLEVLLDRCNVDFMPNPDTQMPPDIFLDTQDHTRGWLEVKAFNYMGSPGFDLADFKSFMGELVEKTYHIYADYLIFGYVMDDSTGLIQVKNIWLKKIWEITCPSKRWPLKVQDTRGVIKKIRPANWYSEDADFKTFESMEDFLAAFEAAALAYHLTQNQASYWRFNVIHGFKQHCGIDIDFPLWEDIKHKYEKTV